MSGGTFSKASRPERPGVYTNFNAVPTTNVPPNTGKVVAIPFTHTWGPFKTAVQVDSYSEWIAAYGSDDSPGNRAVKMAFQGEGLAGRGGAGSVIAYRFGAASAAKASRILTNTTPATAITLTAVYEGTRGNNLRVTKQDYAADATKDQVLIYDGTTLLESYVYTDTDITGLAAQINANSEWVTATVGVSTVALTNVSSSAFASGADGAPPLAADWAAMLSALEVQRFGLFAPYALVDANVSGSTAAAEQASIKTWATNLNNAGKRFITVVGGDLNENITTANVRAAVFGDPNFVSIGVGSVTDANLIDPTTSLPRTLTTAELAPRIAGILAAKGEAQSATFGRLQGISILQGPTEADILTGFDGGTVVLARDSNLDAPVRIEKALTTFITKSDTTRPYLIYRNPKFVMTMHALDREIQSYGEDTVIGQLPVNDKTRQLLIGEMKVLLQNRVDLAIIQPDPSVGVDPDPPPSDNDEFVALLYGIKFGRSIEQVYNTIKIQ